MRTATVLTIALGTTALCVPLASPAFAQQLEGSCGELLTLVEDAGAEIREEFNDALDIANANTTDACTAYIVRVEDAGGIRLAAEGEQEVEAEAEEGVETETQEFSASDTLTQTVEITQEAVVEGEVVLRMPTPDVNIEQGGAEVEIQTGTPSVNIDQAPATILIRQAATNITLDMPQPTITIEQPAPEIIVTMPRPGVSMTNAQPQVSVIMPDPTVTVSQAEPEIDVQVEARLVEPGSAEAASQNTITARTEPVEELEGGATANVQFSKAEPVVRLIEDTAEAQVNVTQAEPQIQFESSDPQVSVNFSGEPTIELRQVGEPTITFQQDAAAEQPEQPVQQAAAVPAVEVEEPVEEAAAVEGAEVPVVVTEDAAEELAEEPAAETAAVVAPAATENVTRERMSPEDTNTMLRGTGEAPQTEMMTVLAGDLEGMSVMTADDADVGSVDRVVSNGDRTYVIVEHGGFLGIGDSEVALPIERIAIRGDSVMLLGLTEEDLDAMPDYDFDTQVDITPDQSIEINNVPG